MNATHSAIGSEDAGGSHAVRSSIDNETGWMLRLTLRRVREGHAVLTSALMPAKLLRALVVPASLKAAPPRRPGRAYDLEG